MNKPSLSIKKAVAAHCKGCTYDPLDTGNWLQQVERCSITSCSLHEHRPLSGKTKRFLREKSLAMLQEAERQLIQIRSENAAKRLQESRNLHQPTHQ